MKIEVTLPKHLQAFVDEQATGEGEASDYILNLIQREKDRQSTRGVIDNLLIEGIESGEVEPFEDDWKEQVIGVVYRVTETTVEIIRVLHGKRDIQSILEGEA